MYHSKCLKIYIFYVDMLYEGYGLMEFMLKAWLCLHSSVAEVSPLEFLMVSTDSSSFNSDAFK
ncbi:hypothetical protein QJS04_geneDACA023314 [Acorus gramineus]|uniref:Uncharacterized protein n=1 Tax=Acorus gramineus TaxID=55184 RepID=A0AAV9BDB2_ACOGR|nr:hypothetical protein QJS04_geneDACA023314 [Acorus gramineus]